MILLPRFSFIIAVLCTVLPLKVVAQNLPGSMSFTTAGSFVNATAQSSSSILLADNDLTNGYSSAFDLTDAPTALNPTGPQGSAAFQWGVASTTSSYPHTSALWFQPIAATQILPEQSFDLGYLYYRNGTIKTTSGATGVELALHLSFSQPLGVSSISEVFGCELINTVNNSDPVASADIVSLRNPAAPLDFSDASGNRYYLELSFKVDQDTIDGTLSTIDQFKVFEGGQGRATLQGRFTTTPASVPEPSIAMLSILGSLMLFRRKR